MAIELKNRKAWGSGYRHDGKQYGDSDWKEKIKSLVANQDYIIVEGRYGDKNLDFHYNIKGVPFSLISKNEFLEKIDKLELGYFDDVYLYDAFENEKAIWSKGTEISESTRYIFLTHTATECQML